MKFERGNPSNRCDGQLMETDALERDGQDGISVDGHDVCVYGIQDFREKVVGRFGGNAFWATGMGLGCQHA